LTGKGLICGAVFGAETAFREQSKKIPRSTGMAGEFCRHPKAGRGATSSGADLAVPEGPLDLPNSTQQRAYHRGVWVTKA
jgi:hypothetical protein